MRAFVNARFGGGLKQQEASPAVELVKRKMQGYTMEHYPDWARDMQSCLHGMVPGTAFQNEMPRFLPTETVNRTIRNPRFADFLEEAISHLADMSERDSHGYGPSFAPQGGSSFPMTVAL